MDYPLGYDTALEDQIARSWADATVSFVEPMEAGQEVPNEAIKATPAQMHLHAPSEHTIDGKSFDVEIHFVNLFESMENGTTYTKAAVIGVMFDRAAGGSESNEFLQDIIDLHKAKLSDSQDSKNTVTVDVSKLDLDTSKYYHYQGSLTTPPCSEIVEWHVLDTVQSISKAQLDYIKTFTTSWSTSSDGATNGNNRMTMPINSRTVYKSFMQEADSASTLFVGAVSFLALASAVAF